MMVKMILLALLCPAVAFGQLLTRVDSVSALPSNPERGRRVVFMGKIWTAVQNGVWTTAPLSVVSADTLGPSIPDITSSTAFNNAIAAGVGGSLTDFIPKADTATTISTRAWTWTFVGGFVQGMIPKSDTATYIATRAWASGAFAPPTLTIDSTGAGEARQRLSSQLSINAAGDISIDYQITLGALPPRTGGWFANSHNALAPTTAAMTANVIRAFPFAVARTVSTDSLSFEVSTAAAGGVLFAIYDSHPDSVLYPGTKVTSTIYDTCSIGVKRPNYAGGNAKILAGKIYWVVYNSNSTATLRAVALGNALALGHNPAMSTNSQYTLYSASRTMNWVLPNTYPDGAAFVANVAPPLLLIRIASWP
jgi:hypothetical protein